MAHLLVIAPTMVFGGLAEHVTCLAIGAASSGDSMTLCTKAIGEGTPLPAECQAEILDLTTTSGLRSLAALIPSADCALLLNSPETAAVAPLLASARTAAIGVHGTPWTNAAWLGRRQHALVSGACRSMPALPLLTPAERDRRGIAEEFGISTSRVLSLPNAVRAIGSLPPPAQTSDRLLLATRISQEKRWLLDAAIDAANATGRDLTVVGHGSCIDQWREELASDCRRPWTLVEDADIRQHIQAADVVVGAGLIAMEAALAGRRVIVPCKSGGWAGAVTPDTFSRMRDGNFVEWDHASASDTAEVFAQAASLTPKDLQDVAERLAHEATPQRLFQRLLSLARRAPMDSPQEYAIAVADVMDDSARTEAKLHSDYALTAEARDFFRGEASRWENAFRETNSIEQAQPDEAEQSAPHSSWAVRSYHSDSRLRHVAAGGLYLLRRQGRLRLDLPRRIAPIPVQRCSEVPRSAWVAVRTGSGWEVTAGEAVEASDHGVLEGVWTGDFAAFRPDLAQIVFGTGLVMTSSGPLFIPSHFVAAPLYAVTSAESVVVSNSALFALVAAGVRASHPGFDDLLGQLRGTVDSALALGMERMPTCMATSHGYSLHLMNHLPFRMRSNGEPVRLWKPPGQRFRDFGQYFELLRSTVSALFDNGCDPRRRSPLRPLATVSRGYDSVAAAVVARQAGCRDAVTFDVTVEGRNDSGEEIARTLGLNVSVQRHLLGDDLPTLEGNALGPFRAAVAEFIAPAGATVNMVLLPLQEQLRDTMLITGAGGDAYWAKDSAAPSGMAALGPGMRPDTEFRLRVGYSYIPVPVIGARFAPPLVALSNSDELAPFSIGGDYDRPIPRRIAEEAGIAREAFGQVKTAVGPVFSEDPAMVSEAAREVSKRYEAWED